MFKAVTTLLTILFALLTPALSQQDTNDEVKNLVVMINADLASAESSGAGIVFNVARNRLYIVTANHVVRRADADADAVTVEFWQLPGEQFEATLLAPLDTSLDMAVLTARIEDVGLSETDFSFGSLTGGDVTASSSITSVGQGSGRDWVTLVEPTNVIQSQAGLLELQAAGVSQGDSGGGVFSDDGKLLGMITNDAPPALRAITAESLLATLEDNRYSVYAAVETTGTNMANSTSSNANEKPQSQELAITEPNEVKLKIDGFDASSSPRYVPSMFDGDIEERWSSYFGDVSESSVTFLFREPHTISKVRMFFPEFPRELLIKSATLSTPDGETRSFDFRGLVGWEEAEFKPLIADKFVLTPTDFISRGTRSDQVGIYELELYGN